MIESDNEEVNILILNEIEELVELDSKLINAAYDINITIGEEILSNTLLNFNLYLENKKNLNIKIQDLIKTTYLKKISKKIEKHSNSLSLNSYFFVNNYYIQ
jgi:hypothetical protein